SLAEEWVLKQIQSDGRGGRSKHPGKAPRCDDLRRLSTRHRCPVARNRGKLRDLGGSMFKSLIATAAALAALAAVPAGAQEQSRLNWVEVHSPAIEGNLEGNSAERKVLVVTPPRYDENAGRR